MATLVRLSAPDGTVREQKRHPGQPLDSFRSVVMYEHRDHRLFGPSARPATMATLRSSDRVYTDAGGQLMQVGPYEEVVAGTQAEFEPRVLRELYILEDGSTVEDVECPHCRR